MEEHKFFITEILNKLLASLGLHNFVVPTHVVMAFLVTLLLVILFKLASRKLTVYPSKIQYFLEFIFNLFRSILDDIIGEEGRKFLPAIATLGIFIATSNLIGLLPEFASPTANINVTAGCAIFIFIYYHVQGVKRHGLGGYLKTFCGPVWWLAPIFVPIEVISHFSRPLSLTVRLFGNIYGEDLVIIILFLISPLVAPVFMMAFAIFTSLLQAYIFVMLSSIYLSGAVSEEH